MQIPISTYRLQFNRDFTFTQAAEIVPYLAVLGITHCYASPYLRARPGSMHGYDIIDHQHLNPEIGTTEEYDRFVAALHAHGMGQILDIVPNHMGVMGSDNSWWLDVLENGEASNYAEFFDIDWEPLKDELQHKVLIPILGDQYGTVLESGDLKLAFDQDAGEFSIWYFQHRFPLNPHEYPRILAPAAELFAVHVEATDPQLLQLQSLISAFGHLPGRHEISPEKRGERVRDKEIHKHRLAELCQASPEVHECIRRTVAAFNGTPGDPGSYEPLHELIKAQAFRLAYWRVAADDINYRRFFDVNDLAAVRQEIPEVFSATHSFVLQLLHQGKINGLRIDHPDGLYDPATYFRNLQQGVAPRGDTGSGTKPNYVVVEKILTGDEELRCDWPISGTTGYEFSALVNCLFVDPNGEGEITRSYEEFIGEKSDFSQLIYHCKKLVINRLLNSELNVLANHLSRIALSDRHTCDFTVKSLRDALTDIVACFPVYRTYVNERQVSAADSKYITQAVESAKSTSFASDLSVYDFVREVLLARQAEGHQPYYQQSVIDFAMRFQQFTSAVMAKGVEDTSFYRYNRLISLNEVGADPSRFGVSPAEFHQRTLARSSCWPHGMLASSTHDSKRSEDLRARINVLPEMPEQWRNCALRWREMNRRHRRGAQAPALNDEYLLYQTLIGSWPFGKGADVPSEQFVDRMSEYMLKAVREAKQHTSWAHRNEEYEFGTTSFVRNVLADHEFCREFLPFQRHVAYFGMLNSLSQMLIRLTAPGVSDTYQGCELWQFNLVDPDNRRPVDYASRERMFDEIQRADTSSRAARYTHELASCMEDGRIKMYVLWKTLQLRKQMAQLFSNAPYVPLEISGSKADHLVAFSRPLGESLVVVAIPRLCAKLTRGCRQLPVGSQVWQDTAVALPLPRIFRNIFTGEVVHAELANSVGNLAASKLFAHFPVALLSTH